MACNSRTESRRKFKSRVFPMRSETVDAKRQKGQVTRSHKTRTQNGSLLTLLNGCCRHWAQSIKRRPIIYACGYSLQSSHLISAQMQSELEYRISVCIYIRIAQL